jgi:hypothetical protein
VKAGLLQSAGLKKADWKIRQATWLAPVLVALVCGSALWADKHKSAARVPPWAEFHSPWSLGMETFILQPSKQLFAIYASAESPAFNGLRLTRTAGRREVLDSDGQHVGDFPRQINFRVTASARLRSNSPLPGEDRPYQIKGPVELEPLLRSLSFRVKVFHGLHMRVIEPTAVRMLGVPADVPYNERIYEMKFDVGQVPTDDKIVLEVLSPEGERLCKFHLEFNWN